MGSRSRHSLFHGRLIGAKIRAASAREAATEAIRAADRAEAEAWSIRMEGYGGPAQPSPSIGQCLMADSAGSKSSAIAARRARACRWRRSAGPRDTPLWKLQASLKCRSCPKGRYAPPVHMIKLTGQREITPYLWVHPDEEDR
jgi:hypothetical protein